MLKLHVSAPLEDFVKYQYRDTEGDGRLHNAVFKVESADDMVTYDIFPTWIQLFPRRLNGIPGTMQTFSKEISIGISKTSRMTQMVDSGRDMHAQVLSVRGEVS